MDTMSLLWQSLPDEAILTMANQNKALLLTVDKNFGELIFRQQRLSTGVVSVRLLTFTKVA
jgi:predicted nuclease of predicted toxin-antitoxin system